MSIVAERLDGPRIEIAGCRRLDHIGRLRVRAELIAYLAEHDCAREDIAKIFAVEERTVYRILRDMKNRES